MKESIFEIVRSFSKTIQVKPYEPESYFCSVKQSFDEMPSEKDKVLCSEYLIGLAKNEVMKSVEKSIVQNTPPVIDANTLQYVKPENTTLSPEQAEKFQKIADKTGYYNG